MTVTANVHNGTIEARTFNPKNAPGSKKPGDSKNRQFYFCFSFSAAGKASCFVGNAFSFPVKLLSAVGNSLCAVGNGLAAFSPGAVGKAQMIKMAPLARSIYDAAKRCEMANGTDGDCVNFENLDVHIPGATYTPYKDGFQAHFSSEFCELTPGPRVVCGGEYQADLSQRALYAIEASGNAYCLAHNEGAYDENKGVGHKVCKSLGGVKIASGWNTSEQKSTFAYYKLP